MMKMYQPRAWPSLASSLSSALYNSDGTLLLNDVQRLINITDVNARQSDQAVFWGVHCTDGPPPPSLSSHASEQERRAYVHKAEQALFDAVKKQYETETSLFAGFLLDAMCMFWKGRATERYLGPWDKGLDIPMLVVGNTADVSFVDGH